jgi:hypothetical protein
MTAPQTSLRSLRNSSVRGCAQNVSRARLSALTLAALATGYYPDGSAPEPGFPRRRLTGVLPASPNNAAVKHAPCRPVLLPVDRGPSAARVRIGNSARGHRTPLLVLRCASRTRPFKEARSLQSIRNGALCQWNSDWVILRSLATVTNLCGPCRSAIRRLRLCS